jgi:XRE family transcriptional regulator, regulator of sulfur utilization
MSTETDSALDHLTRRLGRVIRTHRAERGLSLGALARDTGLSKSSLARIEADGGNPSVETLWRISRALGLPLGALLEDTAAPRVRPVPARSTGAMEADSGMTGWLVHSEGRPRRTELFELDFPGPIDHQGTPHLAGTEELVVCIAGRMAVGPLGEEVDLGPGDACVFEADVPHRYRALEPARAYDWVLYSPSGG